MFSQLYKPLLGPKRHGEVPSRVPHEWCVERTTNTGGETGGGKAEHWDGALIDGEIDTDHAMPSVEAVCAHRPTCPPVKGSDPHERSRRSIGDDTVTPSRSGGEHAHADSLR